MLKRAVCVLLCLLMLCLPLLFCDVLAEEGTVYISELLASSAQRDPDASFDWLELANPGKKSVSLSGWTVCRKNGRSYTFPSGTKIESGKTLLFYCDEGGGKVGKHGNIPFSLKAEGDTLTLTDAAGNTADVFTYPAQYGNISCGRTAPGGGILYFEKATPGAKNTAPGYASRSEAPTLSLPAGRYDSPVTVSCEGAGTLRCTLDGSEVTSSSPVYTEAIRFSASGVLRVRAFEKDKLPSATVSASYIIGFETACPTVSLICDQKYLTGSEGLMIKGNGSKANYDQPWEYPMHADYISADGETLLSQDAGYRVMGEVSRQFTQKAIVLTARKAYSGSSSMDFSPFSEGDAADYSSFKSLVLRSAGSEGMKDGIRFRDAFLTTLAEGTNVLYQSCEPVVVFMNGKVYGHYNLREKVTKHFIAQHEGITDDEVIDAIDILKQDGMVVQGSNEEYLALRTFVKKNDLNKPENLAYVLERVDVDSYFDHCAFEIICGNEDINNSKYYKLPGGKWKWILYDLDSAMRRMNKRPLEWLMESKTKPAAHDFDHFLFAGLMEVPEMRDRFFTRMGELLVTRFTPAFLTERLDQWVERYAPIMAYQFLARPSLKEETWYESIDQFRKQLLTWPEHAVEITQSIFRLTDTQTEQYFGSFLSAYREFNRK